MSLLPCLNPRPSGLCIQMDVIDASGDGGAAPYAPDAIAALRTARVVHQPKGDMGEIFLLSQADTYGPIASELQPLTNAALETWWQTAISAWTQSQGACNRFGLSPPVNDSGVPVAYAPLFYCRQRELYCHPLCPECGSPLELCRQDAVLLEAGLPAFSTSLTRYLYCVRCHGAPETRKFYTLVKPGGDADGVYNARELIEGFSRLLAKPDLADGLPCIQCSETADCYGPDTRVLERMRPIQFYPFYMIVQPAPTVNALDFIPLLAGAPPRDVQRVLAADHRPERLKAFNNLLPRISRGSGMLFDADERQFLEVLYLKLSFLQALLTLVREDTDMAVDRMSMEGIWVHLARHSARLPFLWSFDVTAADPVGRPSKRALGSDAAGARWMSFFGYAWHFVLLVNSRQAMDQVLGALRNRMRPATDAGVDIEAPAQSATVFGPHNIFWNADPSELPGQWREHWDEALSLGTRLLQAADTPTSGLQESIEADIDVLKNAVRQSLFAVSIPSGETAAARENVLPAQERTVSDGQSDAADPAIAQILSAILQQYKKRPEAVQSQPEPQPEPKPELEPSGGGLQSPEEVRGQLNSDGDYEETIILADATLTGGAETVAPPTDDAPEKTVVMQVEPQKGDAPDLDKTVVIQAPEPPANVPDPDATVVIRPESRLEPDPDKTVVIAAPQVQQPTDDLEKTVVIGSTAQTPPAMPTAGEKRPRPAPSNEGDDLEKNRCYRCSKHIDATPEPKVPDRR